MRIAAHRIRPLCLVLLLSLTGCVRLPRPGPPLAWWSLHPVPPPPNAPPTQLPSEMYLARVEVPDYLSHPNLARRLSPERLEYLSGHRWAEPLSTQVPRILQLDLLERLGPGSLLASPPTPPRSLPELRLHLLRFDAGPDEVVHLDAWLEVLDYQDRRLLLQRRIRLQTPLHASLDPAGAPDPTSLVAAHSRILGQLADAVVETLGELPSDTAPSAPPSNRLCPVPLR